MMKDNGISICCITETWLKSDDRAKFAEIHDAGFDIISAPRRGRGGGVAFVYKPDMLNPVRNDVKKFSSFEVVECVIKTVDKVIRLCVVYRSTQTKTKYEDTKISKFMEDFEEYLDSVVNKTGSPLICGDFNFHVEDSSDSAAQNFIALCKSKGFIQQVSSTTHISGGILDLVFTLDNLSDALPLKNMSVEATTGTASDHFLVNFQIPISLGNQKKSVHEEKEMRELSKIDIDKFREDLFTSALNHSNFKSVDQAVQLYHEVVESILDKHAPLITKRFNVKKSEFWNEDCQNSVRERRRAKRKFSKARAKSQKYPEQEELKSALEDLKTDYYEKCVDSEIIINRARNSFYDKQFSSCKGDSRGTYKVINKLLDKEYGANKVPNGLDNEVATKLKTYFDQKVKKIYSNIEDELGNTSTVEPEEFSEAEEPQQSYELNQFKEISMTELAEIIRNLPNKSSDLDIIPMWLFKNCLPELLDIVHFIVNESLRVGMFPTALKQACIRPGLKKPTLDVDELKNYRPISNLTYLSKILEKAIHIQLNDYVDKNNLFSSYQSGYRKYHSCETAVTRIHNDILLMIDQKENVVLLLLDLSAAFDTINHSLLLRKLKNVYRITDVALQWLKSYLSNRTFRVKVNRGSSDECHLDIGVPQGSILGPLLFILYTCDLEKIVTKYGFSIHLYADDTQVYFAFNVHSPHPDLSAVKSCFLEIKEWMSSNFLKLNDDKTEFIDIGPYVSPIQSLDLGCLSITPVSTAKNLGFIFDHQMNLDSQINAVSQICYLNQRNLSRIGSKLTHELKIQLVHSSILSFIDYCNAMYYGLTAKNLQKLQKIQNNAVRFIFSLYGKKMREPIMPYLKKLHFLPVRYRIKFKIALLVFKCLNNLAPLYLRELLHLRDIRRRSSRLDDDCYLLKVYKKPQFTRTDAAFKYSGPNVWNELPYSIRSLSTVESFKQALKTHYFTKAFEFIESAV